MLDAPASSWPELPDPADWQATYETVHLWTQIVGKIRMESTPLENHWWNVPLYVSSRGITTSPIPRGDRTFTLEFDLHAHRLRGIASDGRGASFELGPISVARFYERVQHLLAELDVSIFIWPMPVEIPDPIVPFPDDETHADYDRDAVERLWRVLVRATRMLKTFRSRWMGKASPVHFFWGAFDLAATRFSGREAPPHPGGVPNCADWVMQEAYSHELSSAGFWPGAGLGEPAFYAYAYPEPDGYRSAGIAPSAAYYHEELGEYVLPYRAIRSADDGDALLLDFLQSTYEAAAESGGWDREVLERTVDYRPGS